MRHNHPAHERYSATTTSSTCWPAPTRSPMPPRPMARSAAHCARPCPTAGGLDERNPARRRVRPAAQSAGLRGGLRRRPRRAARRPGDGVRAAAAGRRAALVGRARRRWASGATASCTDSGTGQVQNLDGWTARSARSCATSPRSRTSTCDPQDAEESNEQAYAELVEFVRVGAQLVFEELVPLRDVPGRPTAPLH